jgi:hypothetical protein
MSYFELENKSFDYYTALADIGGFVRMCRQRGWSWLDIAEAVSALGREGEKRMDAILEDMNKRLDHPRDEVLCVDPTRTEECDCSDEDRMGY